MCNDLTKPGSPATAKYVRVLVLKPHSLGHSMYKGPFSYIARKAWKMLGRWKLHVKASDAAAAGRLLKLVKAMSNLNSLVITSAPMDSSPLSSLATTFIQKSLSAHTSTLRSLSISVPFLSTLDSTLMIHSLEEFKVVFYATFNPDKAYPIVISFCARHSQTLTSFALDIFQNDIGISHLFANLPHLPLLAHIDIAVTVGLIESQQATSIESYLQNHADSLRSARFSVSDRCSLPDLTLSELFSHPIFCVELPHLTTLELGLFYRYSTNPFHEPGPLALYLKRFRRSLIRFTLSDYIIPFLHLDDVLTAFDGSPLQYLKVHTDMLRVEVLDYAFEHLSRLRELDWTVEDFPASPSNKKFHLHRYQEKLDVCHSL